MKKLLLIATILGICSFASAQSFTFGYDNQNLNAGDTIQFPYTGSDITVPFQFTNNSNDTITLQVTVNTIDAEGFEVYGVCAGDCMPGNVSPEFAVAPGETYNGCDARISVSDHAEDGLFTVTAANVNDPSDAITVNLHLYQPSGIGDVESAELNIYPNPATSMIHVRYTLPENDGEGQVVLTNMLGATVKSFALSGNEGTAILNVANIPAGVYNVAILSNSKMVSSNKVVIK